MAKNITEGNIVKTFIKMAIPLIIGGLLSKAFNLIDMIMAGKLLSDTAIAAIGGTASFITLISSMFWGLGNGTSIYIATLFGSKQYDKAKSAFVTNLLFVFGLSFFISIIAIVFKEGIFNLLKIDETIYSETSNYYVVYLLGIAFILTNAYCNYVFYAMGDSVFPLLISVLATIINIATKYLFVVYTPYKITGLALSSVLSGIISLVLSVYLILKYYKKIGLKKVSFDIVHIKKSLPLSFPCMAQQSTLYISSTLLQPIVNGISYEATAGYSVGMKVISLISCAFEAASKCVSTYSAQCMGAKKYDKVTKCLVPGYVQNFLFSLPLILIILIFPDFICKLFFDEKSQNSLELAKMCIPICVPFMFAHIYKNLFHSYFRGVRAMGVLLICTLIYSISHIASGYLLAYMGLKGIYWATNIALIIEGIVITIIYFLGLWKPEEYKNWEKQIKL